MQDYPHRYAVTAESRDKGYVRLTGDKLDAIESAPPAEFGGPGDRWSPESLLVAAVADCFVLSFRAIARASRFEWRSLQCSAVGVLDKVDGTTRFTGFEIEARLTVPEDADEARAAKLMEKAERVCLITNSLIAGSHLTAAVDKAG